MQVNMSTSSVDQKKLAGGGGPVTREIRAKQTQEGLKPDYLILAQRVGKEGKLSAWFGDSDKKQ